MRDREPKTDLDLVPIMNLVAILIPFLLLSAQFVQVSAIDNTLPAMADLRPPAEEPLGLRVRITEMGFELSASPYPEPVELGCVGGFCRSATAWDTRALTEALAELKRDWPDEEAMVLEPGSDVPYEVVVATLDAARRTAGGLDLFPEVSIAGGM